MEMMDRITFDSGMMGGKPCIRGMRVTVGMIVGLLSEGQMKKDILEMYPYLESEDIDAALRYAAWRVEEIEVDDKRARARILPISRRNEKTPAI